jgi:putative hydrolase of the HAD superfamily
MAEQGGDDQTRWIAFDAVGTLIFADPPVHLAYYRIGRRYGTAARPEEVLHRFRTAFSRRATHSVPQLDAAIAEGSGETSFDGEARERQFWREVVAEVLPDVHDADACFEELFSHFAQPSAWGCFADVEETLDEAQRRGCRVAIASNFDGRLHAVCDGHPALQLVDRRVISSEVGACKPQPAFFEALLSACNCRPEHVVVVGDDFENDVAAPRRMGIRALHLDRTGTAPDSLRSLCDIWSHIERRG